jgi:hypothetical protein
MSEGVQASSYTSGDKFFIDPMKLLPMERFLPQPKGAPGAGGRGGALTSGQGGQGRGGAPAVTAHLLQYLSQCHTHTVRYAHRMQSCSHLRCSWLMQASFCNCCVRPQVVAAGVARVAALAAAGVALAAGAAAAAAAVGSAAGAAAGAGLAAAVGVALAGVAAVALAAAGEAVGAGAAGGTEDHLAASAALRAAFSFVLQMRPDLLRSLLNFSGSPPKAGGGVLLG